MTRVLLINKLFYPVIGGVETAVAQIAKGLSANEEFEVSILAGNERTSLGNKAYVWNKVSVLKTGSFGLVYNTALSVQFPFALHSLIRSHDVFHFHVPNPLGELSFFFNNIPPYKKVVVTVHADVTQTRRKLYGPLYNFFLHKLLKRADVITTMSPQNLSGFPILQPYLDKCVIIPLAFDASHLVPLSLADKNNFITTYHLDTKRQTLLFVGRLTEDKGVAYLIEAVGSMPEIQLVIAGDGPLKNSLHQLANNSANKHIVFTGFIQGKEIACAYSMATIFVLPSLSETFGLVQAEAMRFGLPVINTALNTGVNSVSIHNETGITVPPGDAVALALAIKSLLDDESLRQKFAENAIIRASIYIPEKMVTAFEEIYLDKQLQSS